jgi:hypothetical protein
MEKSSKLYKNKSKTNFRQKNNKMRGGFLKTKQTVLIEKMSDCFMKFKYEQE